MDIGELLAFGVKNGASDLHDGRCPGDREKYSLGRIRGNSV